MAKKRKYQEMSYEELEEVLLEKVHAYRILQDANELSGYANAIGQIKYRLSFMSRSGPGSLEQLAREQRRQEFEFFRAIW